MFPGTMLPEDLKVLLKLPDEGRLLLGTFTLTKQFRIAKYRTSYSVQMCPHDILLAFT